jgi:3-oxoadipate enol-lactonase
VAFQRVNGIVLHHRLVGAEGAPVLVFSNSLGTDLRIWDGVAALLAGRFRLLFYDSRGHGLSEETPSPTRMTDHVEDLAALLAHHGIAGATVVGLSVGGMIAQGLAALEPERVGRLVLIGTAHKIGTEDSWNARIAAVREGGIAAIADGVLQLWFTAAYRRDDNADFAGYRNMLLRSPVTGYVGTCAAVRDADLTESTRALGVPTLAMAGEEDGSTPPELVRQTAALIRGAAFRVIPGAAHIACIERADAVAELIAAFAGGRGAG